MALGIRGSVGRAVSTQDLAFDAQQLGHAPTLFGAPGPLERLVDYYKSLARFSAIGQPFRQRADSGDETPPGLRFAKLLEGGTEQAQSGCDIACFGEKDYQQLQVIRSVVRDLDIPVRIEGVPTVREADGLALSSRNAYLTPAERAVAPSLHRILAETAARIESGETIATVVEAGLAALGRAGFARIDYLEACDAESLAPLARADRPGRLLAAAWLGRTRLIDNAPLAPAPQR